MKPFNTFRYAFLVLTLAIVQPISAQSWEPIAGNKGDGVKGANGSVLTITNQGKEAFVAGEFTETQAQANTLKANSLGRFIIGGSEKNTWLVKESLPQLEPLQSLNGNSPSVAINGICTYSLPKTGKESIAVCGRIVLDDKGTVEPAAYQELSKGNTIEQWHTFSYAKNILLNSGFIANSLAWYHGELYLGGRFFMEKVTVSHIPPMPDIYYRSQVEISLLKLDASGVFQAVPNSPMGTIYTLKVIGDELYVGGDFNVVTDVQDSYARNIAITDGTDFSPVGNTQLNIGFPTFLQGLPLPVYCINSITDKNNQIALIAGTGVSNAVLSTAGTLEEAMNRLKASAPNASILGSTDLALKTIIPINDASIGGVWQLMNAADAIDIWKNIGRSNAPVLTMDVLPGANPAILAGGIFTQMGNESGNLQAIPYIAKYTADSNRWKMPTAATQVLNGPITSIIHYQTKGNNGNQTDFIVGGHFNKAGEYAVNNLARLNSSNAKSNSIQEGSKGSIPCQASFSTNTLSLELPDANNQQVHLEIYDLSGKSILSKDILLINRMIRQEMLHTAAGMYVVHVGTTEGNCSTKFVKLSD